MPTRSRAASGRGRARSAAIAATRRSSWRWSSSARFTGETRYLDLARYFIDERGQPAALFRHRGAGARQPIRRLWYHRPTSTTSRTCRCASRTRSSATRCARCTCIRPWPTSRPRTAMPDLHDACVRLWHDLTREAPLCHRRARPVLDQRGLHARLRPAERDRLRRDLRRGRPGVLGASHAADDRRGALRRRHGAGAVQRRPQRPVAATASGSSTRTRWPAAAASTAGSGIAARAVRPTSRGWSPRSVSMSPRSRRASCRCISTARAGSPRRSMGAMSNCVRRRGSRGMAMSRSRSAPLGRRTSRCGCAFRTGAPRSASR